MDGTCQVISDAIPLHVCFYNIVIDKYDSLYGPQRTIMILLFIYKLFVTSTQSVLLHHRIPGSSPLRFLNRHFTHAP